MIILRPASLDDTAALAHVGRTSFCAAFEDLYQPSDLAQFLDETYSETIVAREIASDRCIHQLAFGSLPGRTGTKSGGRPDAGEALVGYCKLNYPSDYLEHSAAANPIALGQLYTAPGSTGMGIGAMLMEWALGEARERGHGAMQLSVYSENYGAQRFYARYGFTKIADIGFWVGQQRDAEFLYELRLE